MKSSSPLSRLFFYIVVAVPGGVLMALEIVSSRVLAPEFGTSVYVWGSIIGVFLAAMSVGYVLGGRWADRRPELPNLGRILFFSALAQALVLIFGEMFVAKLGEATGGAPWGTLVVIALLFGPATVLLATVAPYVVKLAAQDLGLLGDTAGRLYAVSTAGSLLGTLGATFVLIPQFELITILRLLMLTTVAVGLVAGGATFRGKHRYSGPFALGLIVLALLGGGREAEDSVIARRMTPYQTLMIQQDGDIRYFQSNNVMHAGVDMRTGEPSIIYPRFVAAGLLFREEMTDFLTLGMGGGTVGTYLQNRLPDVDVTYVEIDPAVPAMAKEYLMYEEHERSRVVVDDARHFLKQGELGEDGAEPKTWDFIYSDTFIGPSVPFHLTTVEFFRLAKQRLKPGGILAVHMADNAESVFGRAVLKTLSVVFTQTYVFNIPGGMNLYIATDDRVTVDRDDLIARGKALDQTATFEPSLEQVAGNLLRIELDLSQSPILHDGYAPANYLIDEYVHRELRALSLEEGLEELAPEDSASEAATPEGSTPEATTPEEPTP